MSGPYEMSDSRLVDALRDLTATLKAENDFAEQEAASKADARRIIR